MTTISCPCRGHFISRSRPHDSLPYGVPRAKKPCAMSDVGQFSIVARYCHIAEPESERIHIDSTREAFGCVCEKTKRRVMTLNKELFSPFSFFDVIIFKRTIIFLKIVAPSFLEEKSWGSDLSIIKVITRPTSLCGAIIGLSC